MMRVTLNVSNLPETVSDDDLLVRFGDYGLVESTMVIRDSLAASKECGAKVVMANDEEAQAAIDWLHGTHFKGRTISVTRAGAARTRPQAVRLPMNPRRKA